MPYFGEPKHRDMNTTITIPLFVKGTDGEEFRNHKLPIEFHDSETWDYDLPEWADDSDPVADVEDHPSFQEAIRDADTYFAMQSRHEPFIKFNSK